MIMAMTGCGSSKGFTYVENIDSTSLAASRGLFDARIMPKDELTITVNREAEEAASNILIECGSQGVAIDDSADYLGKVGKYGEVFPEVEQVEMVTITAYYPESADMTVITVQVNDACKIAGRAHVHGVGDGLNTGLWPVFTRL